MFYVEELKRDDYDKLDRALALIVLIHRFLSRHTWLYMMRQKGISAEIQAELAGHSLETTMKYGSPKR